MCIRDSTSPELTGEWEAKLRLIERGDLSGVEFMNQIRDYAHSVISSNQDISREGKDLGDCPRCGEPVIQGNKGMGCSAWRDGCDFVLWPTYKDAPLNEMEMRSLIQRGVGTGPLKLSDGNEVVLRMTDSGRLVEIPTPNGQEQVSGSRVAINKAAQPFPNMINKPPSRREKPSVSKSLGICPQCGSDVVEQTKSFSCSKWKTGCSFTIWKKMSGKRISGRTARTLLRDGKTSLLKGFKSKSGKPFNARLQITDGTVKMDFDD